MTDNEKEIFEVIKQLQNIEKQLNEFQIAKERANGIISYLGDNLL